MPHITASQFQNRFVTLIIGGRDFPKKHLDRHILFISAILGLEPQRQYSESELNAELKKWVARFGSHVKLDYATLRRFLVDERYVRRDRTGTSYQVAATDVPYTFDRSIEALDLEGLVVAARTAQELKKQQYLSEIKI